MKPSRILRCFVKMTVLNSLKLWKSNSMTTGLVTIGILCYTRIYLLAPRQSWPFGPSSAKDFRMGLSISIRLNYVHMEVSKLGVKTTGTCMLQLSHGQVSDSYLFWPRFTDSNPRALILFLRSLKPTWTYQSTWSFLLVSIPLMFLIVTGAVIF
jgi:hypothetical protein